MTTRRRALLGALAAAPLATPAFGQARFPNRPIRFMIPWPPGGSLDALHRAMFEVFQKDTGQPVIIENMPGARGTRAAIFLIQQARPDGYTLAHHHLSILRHPYLTRAQTWDPVNDFSYIMQLTGFTFGTVVRADSPFRTWQDMMAHAKANPGRLTYSTSGIATTNHIAKEDILAREGARMEHIPMRGAQEGVTALLGRQIDMISDAQAWRPQVENGDFRLLAAWTPTRLASAPNAPTLRELGYGMSVTSPYGIAGPKGMDPEIVDRLHRLFKKAMEDETSQAIMNRWEMPREYLGPAEYLAFARERIIYEQEMVRRLNLSID
ncbi:tripartite tricarboxylate transporter substrate binding protein [Sabulicella rubraurantiaca]|uniref:tripartite tricarboxylate transporter substrate binding protein n=1 Tax=Sabulicella rubraurantiaca TaxID=2811429 RepID=UPI001A95F508|nr:tripartite tricarboxylate transporter substrate binding protein [Sabulicella rubraurantiaca]